MSTREIKRRRVVYDRELHCDGPNHEGKTLMQCDTITVKNGGGAQSGPLVVEHGYGSPLDMQTQHFCSMRCLCDWTKEVGGKLVEPRYQLDQLLAGVTPENVHGEIETGPPVGNEFGAG